MSWTTELVAAGADLAPAADGNLEGRLAAANFISWATSTDGTPSASPGRAGHDRRRNGLYGLTVRRDDGFRQGGLDTSAAHVGRAAAGNSRVLVR